MNTLKKKKELGPKKRSSGQTSKLQRPDAWMPARSSLACSKERGRDTTHDVSSGYRNGTYKRTEYIWFQGMPRVVIESTKSQGVNYYVDARLGSAYADKQGLIRRVLDQSRNDKWKATYDEFGQTLTQSGTLNMSLRYPGQINDPALGLFYNWNRWYDPARGRYMTPDPMGEIGAYPYAGANPI